MGLKVCVAGLCAAVIAVMACATPRAEAATKKKRVVSKQSELVVASRPRTRIIVQRRSFLDAGTNVQPGERKFLDYAFPPGYSATSVIDNHAGHHRSPLPGPFELPGSYPW